MRPTFAFLLWAVALGVGGVNAAATPLVRKQDSAALFTQSGWKWSDRTKFSFPGMDEFTNATERWTTYEAPSYWGAVSPATEDDVAQIVKIASRYNVPFLATGGRHGYTTTIGRLDRGLAIDLSKLNSLDLDAKKGLLTAGPGLRVGEIFDPLFNAGWDIQTGSATCPSLIGVTIGGGVGRYQGTYGLLIDALVSVRMVSAKGDIVEASKTKNPDLFWGIRGAGANFGIIVSATYQAHRITDGGDNFVGLYTVPQGKESEYFKLLERMQPLDGRLSSFMQFAWSASTNQTQAIVQWVYKGREAAALKAMKPLIDFGLNPLRVEMRKWNKLLSDPEAGSFCNNGIPRNLYSWNLKHYDAAAYTSSWGKLDKFFAQYPAGRNSVLSFEFFPNQAMATVRSDETAWPWRDTTGYNNFNILFDEGDQVTNKASNELGLEIRKDIVATSGFPEVTVFVNYAHGDEPIERIYGQDKLPRLAALKKKWDPKKAFSWNNGLPTKYP